MISISTENTKRKALARYQDRRAYAIKVLGGVCVVCGATTRLEIDHIFRSDKSFPISQMWSISLERFNEELAKCQLLCYDCHKAKSLWEVDRVPSITVHGTLTSYKHCKCKACRKAYSEYYKKYSKKTP